MGPAPEELDEEELDDELDEELDEELEDELDEDEELDELIPPDDEELEEGDAEVPGAGSLPPLPPPPHAESRKTSPARSTCRCALRH